MSAPSSSGGTSPRPSSPRKRTRSPDATDAPTPPEVEQHPETVSRVAAETAAELWRSIQQRTADAQWRRGCFALPFQPAAASPPPPSPAANTTAAAAHGDHGVAAARCTPQHPWKVLQHAEQSRTTVPTVSLPAPKAALVPLSAAAPAFLAAPVVVQLQRWNSYWEAFSINCAEELEGLAQQLAALPTSSDGYRRVLLTLSAPPDTAAASQQQQPLSVRRLPSPISSPSASPSRSPTRQSAPDASMSVYSYSSYSSSYTASTPPSRSCSTSSTGDASSAIAVDGDAALASLPHVLDDLVYHHAHHFGAIEHVEMRDTSASAGTASSATLPSRVIMSVQFTTHEAAGLLYRWADGIPVADVIAAYRRDTSARVASHDRHEPDALPPPRAHQQAWWAALEEAAARRQLCLVARLAPHDPRRHTSALLLGPNVMVSTPLVTSLFTGLFDTTRVDYLPSLRAFSIAFATKEECRLALHALQCSLKVIFGLPLIYAAPPVLPS
ncbi:hypothetical protein NESM_000141200 [Novymonas esmeraldas]|uniref:Uncharacterized protein n=1 Tax=Novymonas esmeraldas TaxID=1808958 RepID=A0AAW0F3B7_9TRYP